MALVSLLDVSLSFGGAPLLDRVNLQIERGERVCLVGRNGSGKSTLFRIAAGLVEPDRGTRFVQPGAIVRYLAQEPDFSGVSTTLEYVEAGLNASDDEHVARYFLEQLGLTGAEDPAHLSGGEARRAALARVLAPDPDVLLLDEPFSSVDALTRLDLHALMLDLWRLYRHALRRFVLDAVLRMDRDLVALLGFVVMFALMALRVPIGVAMGIAGVGGFYMLTSTMPALNLLANVPLSVVTDYNLSVIPMFVLMGAFASHAGMSRELFQAGRA